MEDSFRSFIPTTTVKASQETTECREPVLLPDECVSSRFEGVECQWQLSDSFHATLICTNFRLFIFHSKNVRETPQRFIDFDERNSIPLCSILRLKCAIFPNGKLRVAGSGATERELKMYKEVTTTLSTSSDMISSLKIYLKDMRVLRVDLGKSQNPAALANHLLHFAHPARLEHLVQLKATLQASSTSSVHSVHPPTPPLPYTDEKSWKCELERFLPPGETIHWRTFKLTCLAEKRLLSSYPRWVVLCRNVSAEELEESLRLFIDGRFPVWTFAFGGSSLLRSSTPSHPDSPLITRMETRFGVVHPLMDAPRVIHVHLSLQQVTDAFEKLHKICAVDNVARARRYSREWPSRVSWTGWLSLVDGALQQASLAVSAMADEHTSVWLQEESGRDGVALLASLIQICLDKQTRRLDGLRRLIAKEWTGLGHEFGSCVLGVGGAPFRPLFLLFLDCVHQLIRIYPMQFEYSSSCLVGLWDLALSGLCPSLATGSPDSEPSGVALASSPLPLSNFFRPSFVALTRSMAYHASVSLSSSKKTKKAVLLHCDIIRPPTTIANLDLWDECFLRWQPDVVIEGGGSLSSEIAIDEKMVFFDRSGALTYSAVLPNISLEDMKSTYPYSSSQNLDLHVKRPSLGSISSLQILDSTDVTPTSTPLASRNFPFRKTQV